MHCPLTAENISTISTFLLREVRGKCRMILINSTSACWCSESSVTLLRGQPRCESLAEDTKLTQNGPCPLRWPGDMFVPHKTAEWKEIRSYLFVPLEPGASWTAVLPQRLREVFLQKEILRTRGSWGCEYATVTFPWDKLNILVFMGFLQETDDRLTLPSCVKQYRVSYGA